jgi:hypothetical protein
MVHLPEIREDRKLIPEFFYYQKYQYKNMIIRELKDGIEYTCTEEEGEIVRCPVCKQKWMQDIEGDCTHDSCSHLRFVFHTDGDFVDTYGNWDSRSYINNFEVMRDQLIEEDTYDEMIFFQKLKTTYVDEIVYWCWNGFPLVQWTVYWGFKRN